MSSEDSDAVQRLVSITLERTIKRMGQWDYATWHIANVQDLSAGTVGDPYVANGAALTPSRFIWSPIPIVLHEDAAEGYWYNLSSDTPSVFAVCTDDEPDTEAAPVTLTIVTLNHDEAAAHLETDDTVMSIAMPESLRAWLERFVQRHYKPQKRGKRKRTDWSEEQHEAERPRAQRPIRGA